MWSHFHKSVWMTWAIVLLATPGRVADANEVTIQEIIQRLITDATSLYRQEMEEVYVNRQYEPMWVSSNGLTEQSQAIVEVLRHATQEGLNPVDYDPSELQWLQRTGEMFSGDEDIFRANVLARYEVVLSKNILKFLDHVSGGRVDPERINGSWHREDQRPALIELLRKVVHEGMTSTLGSMSHDHVGYERLRDALNGYRQVAADGGWPFVEDGPLLAPGSRSSRVKTLRQRLAATGDLDATNGQSDFTPEVSEAVSRFQARHGLVVDGVVGSETVASLNEPVESRIRTLQLNLERHRWLPRTFGSEYVLVNIPDFRLTAYRNGTQHLNMRVIVGQRGSQTPIFGDVLEYIVFHPYWNIPQSIVREEIFPKFQDDPAYLEKKNFELVNGDDQPVERHLFTGKNIESRTIRLRQKPGPTNALGKVKFMSPNDHAIYLHDTPADRLFEASERDFSHGCIRLERPTDFAEFLLGEQWSREDILRILNGPLEQAELSEQDVQSKHDDLPKPADSPEQTIHLPQAIPVYIVYLTSWVADDGTLQFREDIYGHDDELWAVLHPVVATANGRPMQP